MPGTDLFSLPADLGDAFTAREMPRVFRSDPVRWEILYDGVPVGWIHPHRIGRRALSTFYSATAYMPETGQEINIEASADLHERCRAILNFRADPWSSVHIGWQLKPSTHSALRGGGTE